MTVQNKRFNGSIQFPNLRTKLNELHSQKSNELQTNFEFQMKSNVAMLRRRRRRRRRRCFVVASSSSFFVVLRRRRRRSLSSSSSFFVVLRRSSSFFVVRRSSSFFVVLRSSSSLPLSFVTSIDVDIKVFVPLFCCSTACSAIV